MLSCAHVAGTCTISCVAILVSAVSSSILSRVHHHCAAKRVKLLSCKANESMFMFFRLCISFSNKECPTCRKKLVSKRSLRPDPNFDKLITKVTNITEPHVYLISCVIIADISK